MAEIGPYRVEGVLGSGGVGTVYSARLRSDGTAIALKRIPADRCSDSVRERFRREAGAALSIRHPNVVRVLDHGTGADGSLWLAMEMLEGDDLKRVLSRGRLSAREVIRIGAEAAAGLAAAHELGIVHRDVKPANLFLCRDGTVKVLDFGLAIGVPDTSSLRVTATGAMVGTPAYMAVEQVIALHTEDVRTDVWGLGASLFAALAGRPPFAADSIVTQLFRIVQDDPDPLPDATPPELAQVVLRALNKAKDRRWPTMSALREALLAAGAILADRAELGMSTIPDGIDPTLEATMPEPLRRPAALAGEIRVVSVLVAVDVSDPARLGAVIEREMGSLVWLPGGGGVGVFGGDAWRGDEAERAVRAGLEARRAGLALRLAVGTGRARVQSAGAIGGAAVSSAEAVLADQYVGADEETVRRVRGRFRVEGARVLQPQPGGPMLRLLGVDTGPPALYGRRLELDRLTTATRRAWDQGAPGGVVVTGVPGIGKSRLVNAFVIRLAESGEDFTLLHAQAESHRRREGWHAINAAVRGWLELDGAAATTPREGFGAIVPAAVAEVLAEALERGDGSSPLASESADRVAVRRAAVFALLHALAAARPVLLVVDDLQWADAPSLELLSLIPQRLRGQRVFVIGTARSGWDPPAILDRLDLAPLSRDATSAIASAVLGEPAPEALVDRCAGNPLLAEELALAAREGLGALSPSVGAAVQAHLDMLSREDRDLLRRASVLGRRFWAEGLSALGEAAPEEALARLRRMELVLPADGSRLAGLTEWTFRQALVQEVAYASLTPEQVVALHEAAARWLASVPDASPVEIAEHFEAAACPGEAVPHWGRAARRAARHGDPQLALAASERALARVQGPDAHSLQRIRIDALFHLGRLTEDDLAALEATARTPSELAAAKLRHVDLLRATSRHDEALVVAQAAVATAPDDPLARVWLGRSLHSVGRLPIGAEVELVRLARSIPDPFSRALALAGLANLVRLRGDIALFLQLLEEIGDRLERSGRLAEAAETSINRAYAMILLARWQEAAAGFEQAASLARLGGYGRMEGFALHNLGMALAKMGDLEGGLAAEAAGSRLALAVPSPRLGVVCAVHSAVILYEHGRPAEALEWLQSPQCLTAAERGPAEPIFLTARAMALAALGRSREARDDAAAALRLRDRDGGMEELESELFLVADELGIDGALARGAEVLLSRAGKISDPQTRERFLTAVPANARLLAAARAAGYQGQAP